jgi:hypothetical protein
MDPGNTRSTVGGKSSIDSDRPLRVLIARDQALVRQGCGHSSRLTRAQEYCGGEAGVAVIPIEEVGTGAL